MRSAVNRLVEGSNPSCPAKFASLALMVERKKMKICLYCNAEFKPSRNSLGKYCSNKCQHLHQRKPFEELKGPVAIRKRILELRGHYCSICENTVWMGQPIPLDMDHIDGDHTNNSEDNLRLICPNCHAQTPTYKAKNKGNGRSYRSKRYAEGKSY